VSQFSTTPAAADADAALIAEARELAWALRVDDVRRYVAGRTDSGQAPADPAFLFLDALAIAQDLLYRLAARLEAEVLP
jgi:hypothetical protein